MSRKVLQRKLGGDGVVDTYGRARARKHAPATRRMAECERQPANHRAVYGQMHVTAVARAGQFRMGDTRALGRMEIGHFLHLRTAPLSVAIDSRVHLSAKLLRAGCCGEIVRSGTTSRFPLQEQHFQSLLQQQPCPPQSLASSSPRAAPSGAPALPALPAPSATPRPANPRPRRNPSSSRNPRSSTRRHTAPSRAQQALATQGQRSRTSNSQRRRRSNTPT